MGNSFEELEELFGQLYDSAKKVNRPERDVGRSYSEDSELYSCSSVSTGVYAFLASDYHPDELFKDPMKALSGQVAELCECDEGYEETVEKEVEVEKMWPLPNETEIEEVVVEKPVIMIPSGELIEYMHQPIQEELAGPEAQDFDSGTLMAYGDLVNEALLDGIHQVKNENNIGSDVKYIFQFDDYNRATERIKGLNIGKTIERELRPDITYTEEAELFVDRFKYGH